VKRANILIRSVKHLIFITSILVTSTYVQADELDDFIQKIMKHKKIPGLQLAIVKDNKIVRTGNYGVSNVQDSVPVSDKTIFPINSMTKLFTGVAIMQLVEQQKLVLTAPISTYLSDLPHQWGTTTTKQLLANTSGLPDIMTGRGLELISLKAQDAWAKVKTLPFESPINSKYSYNQTGYVLLGMIIEKISGKTFIDFITEKQLQKVNMNKTILSGFAYPQHSIPNQARQYRYDNQGKLNNINGRWPLFLSPAAGMSSTATELAQYAIALQQGELFEKSTSLAELWSPQILNNGKIGGFGTLQNGYALGWQVIAREKHPAVSSSGANASTLIVYPEDNLSIVVLGNLSGGEPIFFIDEIAGFYIPEMRRKNGWSSGIPSNLTRLINVFEDDGFKKALKLAVSMNKHDVTFNEATLNNLGYALIQKNQAEQALALFKINIQLHPKSSNAFDSLGEIYLEMGMKKEAIENYEKALQLSPENESMMKQLNLANKL
jgi:CubicO group peptidase (beta-lactamase class C family)